MQYDSSLFFCCLFDQTCGTFRSGNNPTLEGFGMTSKVMSVKYNITSQKTYLIEPDVYSTEGCIGSPLQSVIANMSYTDNTDATAIQILSYASHRPGHILSNSYESKSRAGNYKSIGLKTSTHLLPKPNAAWGSSFIPESLFFSSFSKRSGLNFRGSGYACSSWRIALMDVSLLHSRKWVFVFHTKCWRTLYCLLGFDNHCIRRLRSQSAAHP